MEYFSKPTDGQKKQLALLSVALKGMGFNIFTFIYHTQKKKGYFPPIDAVLRIAHNAVKKKPAKVWAYFTKALSEEFPKHFADLNIGQAQRLKKEPLIIGEIMRRIK